ncbi:predicted protein [Verticillium alfalfae VaMs.102]|uniref:Predicted protein n=1 Tax=Verticillium alfalfae (strain VaMs.102 / ATCC MYA-4576 / FGSC 10136) TaxID=526221 RepID=C9SMK0_VERA1|nr:predicted protein [Verticillium alfalfae VaMs.102]EEY20015.1 predicted protein [Verticillium alfalfae VaMs.102]
MPIGDLLASISGDSSRPSSTPPLPRANSNLKRKAMRSCGLRSQRPRGLRQTSSKFKSSARPVNGPSRPTNGLARPTNGTSRPGGPPHQRNIATKDPHSSVSGRGKDKRAPPVEEKKIKKAAVATTGYTGTARPRPGTTSKAKPAAPGGALLNPRTAPRYGGSSKRSRYDEDEDEEMDDFIDYDDEEEDDMGGPSLSL